MNNRLEYGGFIILALPYQLGDNNRWTLNIQIELHTGDRVVMELHPWQFLGSWRRPKRLRIWPDHWPPITLSGCGHNMPLKEAKCRLGVNLRHSPGVPPTSGARGRADENSTITDIGQRMSPIGG